MSKLEETLKEASIRAAFGQVLSDWPHEMSVDDVLDGIGHNEDISVWEPFENWDEDEVCKQIFDLAAAFRSFAEMVKQMREDIP
tara:strand:+ start:185 stop:436 length:252 start_codon:yes stop_codon:yes gene_type:complete